MMRKMTGKQVLSILLAGTMLISVGGCQSTKQTVIEPMEPEEVISYSYDFIGGKDVMPISSYYTMHSQRYSYEGNDFPDLLDEKYFEMAADIGINVLGKSQYSRWESEKEDVIRILELGAKYGMGVVVNDNRVLSVDQSLQYIDECIKEYSGYPAYCGNYVVDEPNYPGVRAAEDRQLSEYTPIFNNLAQLGIQAYGNLYNKLKSGSAESFKSYIKDYVEQGNVKFLGFDKYPFDVGDNYDDSESWFENLKIFREASEEYGLPYWVFIQAGAQWNDAKKRFDSDGYFPSRGAFNWMIGTSLAYGAKGIQYFTLVQPEWFAYAESEPYDFQRNGMIGAFGNKNRWYYYAKDMNAQIAAVDEVLMNSVHKGVIATSKLAKSHIGDSAYLLKGTSWRELKDVDGDVMIGCFNYNGKTALYVVNYDIEYAQYIHLDFQDNYKVRVVQDAETKRISAKGVDLTLSAGNAALIVFE